MQMQQQEIHYLKQEVMLLVFLHQDNSPQVEDLGGPTPDNYSPTNDSAKLKPAGGTLKQVRDVVNKKGAKPAEQ